MARGPAASCLSFVALQHAIAAAERRIHLFYRICNFALLQHDRSPALIDLFVQSLYKQRQVPTDLPSKSQVNNALS
jgi:hypothetical protein